MDLLKISALFAAGVYLSASFADANLCSEDKAMFTIRSLRGEEAHAHKAALARVLVECVEGGASVSFLAPFSQADAERFFDRMMQDAASGNRVILAAFEEQSLVGTVQVVLNMPPNQPHRAEIAKLLVRPAARGKGVAAALMVNAEDYARTAGKTLLVLDTVTGSTAEALYVRLGWTKVGVIPDYALFPDGSPCDTTIFWKWIA